LCQRVVVRVKCKSALGQRLTSESGYSSPMSTSAVSFCSKKGTARPGIGTCSTRQREAPAGLGATSLATVMQMVANGYGVTLVPEVAVGVEARDDRVKLMRFVELEPARTIGLAWRRRSPRKNDFVALGQIVGQTLAGGSRQRSLRKANKKGGIAPPFFGDVWRRYSAAPPLAAWGWSPPSARCLPSRSSPVA